MQARTAHILPSFSPTAAVVSLRERLKRNCCHSPCGTRTAAPRTRPSRAATFRCSQSEAVGVGSAKFPPSNNENSDGGGVEMSDLEADDSVSARGGRSLSVETRRKISTTMLGVPKSAEMRAKLSASMKKSMKTRTPWNKGKTMSLEARKKMSESRKGRATWNKGIPMSEEHKRAISLAKSASKSTVSDSTRRLLQLARRRPGDAIISGAPTSKPPDNDVGYPLVDTADINTYVSLRRSLRKWSDDFVKRIGRRPSLADVRRTARPNIVRDFELYVAMRGAIRGLANDVCGDVDPTSIPVTKARDASASSPRNNNVRSVRYTTYGNPRLASDEEVEQALGGQGSISCSEGEVDAAALAVLGVSSTRDDMWDAYDTPISRPSRLSGFGIDHSLVGAHELDALTGQAAPNSLSVGDFRAIGKYRLMESKDIYKFVQLRRELEAWSANFKMRTGRTPRLSDVQNEADQTLYSRFCKYLDMRYCMTGLVKEVYGTDIDKLESTCDEVTEAAQGVLDLLRSSSN